MGIVLLSAFFVMANAQENVIQGEKRKTDAVKTEVKKTDLIQSGEMTRHVTPEAVLYDKLMMNGAVKTCFGQFFDSGGPTGSYKENEDYTYTIESESENAYLILRFVEFYLSEGDELTVYDGNSTGAKVIGTFSNSNRIPFELKSSGSSLTFSFKSDALGNGSGWRASIACYEGARKILRTDGMTPSVRVIYSIDGIKSENDVRVVEDILSANENILSSNFDKSSNLLTVAMTNESYKDVILEQIISSREATGHDLTVKIREIIASKPLNY